MKTASYKVLRKHKQLTEIRPVYFLKHIEFVRYCDITVPHPTSRNIVIDMLQISVTPIAVPSFIPS